MKKKTGIVLTGLLITMLLSSCGSDPALTQFRTELDSFCSDVAEINDAINKIDAGAEGATSLALDYLDRLDQEFQKFAEMDFPKDYDYLEPLADEAGEYMSEAVKNYHLAYADDGYDATTAAYARENSARAFKRVQVILDVLHGNTPSKNSSSENDSGNSSGD